MLDVGESGLEGSLRWRELREVNTQALGARRRGEAVRLVVGRQVLGGRNGEHPATVLHGLSASNFSCGRCRDVLTSFLDSILPASNLHLSTTRPNARSIASMSMGVVGCKM